MTLIFNLLLQNVTHNMLYIISQLHEFPVTYRFTFIIEMYLKLHVGMGTLIQKRWFKSTGSNFDWPE